MSESHNAPMTLEPLAAAYQQIQNQFEIAQAQVTGLHNELATTRNELHITRNALLSIQTSTLMSSIKLRKPEPFNGKGSVRSWITHLNNYIGTENNPHSMNVAVSYLQGSANELWLGYKETEDGRQGNTWTQLQQALIDRFETYNNLSALHWFPSTSDCFRIESRNTKKTHRYIIHSSPKHCRMMSNMQSVNTISTFMRTKETNHFSNDRIIQFGVTQNTNNYLNLIEETWDHHSTRQMTIFTVKR